MFYSMQEIVTKVYVRSECFIEKLEIIVRIFPNASVPSKRIIQVTNAI